MSRSARRFLLTALILATGLFYAAKAQAAVQQTTDLTTADAIESAARSAGEGSVWFEFPARSDVWGDGEGWYMGSIMSSDRDRDCECTNGPVIVQVVVADGQVSQVRSQVGGESGSGDYIGIASSTAAAEYLLGLAARLPEESAEEAMQAAVAAKDAETWPTLLDIARNQSRPSDIRSTALFWVAHEAGSAAADQLEEIAVAPAEDIDVQEAAVFAITQLPNDRGTDLLLDIARENKNPDIIQTVYFWLGQTDDPRAVRLFEEVLLR